MDYRSSQYRQQQQRKQNVRKEEDYSDSFIRLSDHEIAGCITDMGIPFTSNDIQRPQPQQIQKVFEHLADYFLNTSRETVEPAMREAARDVCGDELADIVPIDTRNLMGFYASLRRILEECGVRDFTFSDLIRPQHNRLARHLSYVINFVRFRDPYNPVIESNLNRLASTKSRIEELRLSNVNLAARRDELKERRQRQAQAAERNERSIGEIRAHLLSLKQETDALQATADSGKAQRSALTKSLQDTTARALLLKQECDKLRPYAAASSSSLQAQLSELAGAVGRDKSALSSAERRLRALHGSGDTFDLASRDVQQVVSLLNSLSTDLAAEEREGAEAARRRDALTERSLNVRGIERDEEMLKAQLRRWSERTEALRKGAEERGDAEREKREMLDQEHRRLISARGERGREVEKRKDRVELTEKKMADLRDNIENEVSAARDEFVKMDSHIRLYMREMEQYL